MNRASSYVVAAACLLVAGAGSLRQAEVKQLLPAVSASLDYEFFKNKVQAVFLSKRPGHTRCIVCHTQNNAPSPSGGLLAWHCGLE